MPTDWNHLQNETEAAQQSFLDTELDTGITLARIALKAVDPDKISRNASAARKAYDTIVAFVSSLPENAAGRKRIREKMGTLKELLDSLEARS